MSLGFSISPKGQITVSSNISILPTHGNLMNCLTSMIYRFHIQTQTRYIAYHSQTDSAMKQACLISMEKSIFKPPPMPFLNTGHLLSIFSKHILIIPKRAQQRFGKVTIKTCQLPG